MNRSWQRIQVTMRLPAAVSWKGRILCCIGATGRNITQNSDNFHHANHSTLSSLQFFHIFLWDTCRRFAAVVSRELLPCFRCSKPQFRVNWDYMLTAIMQRRIGCWTPVMHQCMHSASHLGGYTCAHKTTFETLSAMCSISEAHTRIQDVICWDG